MKEDEITTNEQVELYFNVLDRLIGRGMDVNRGSEISLNILAMTSPIFPIDLMPHDDVICEHIASEDEDCD